jgi:hypothetical protein
VLERGGARRARGGLARARRRRRGCALGRARVGLAAVGRLGGRERRDLAVQEQVLQVDWHRRRGEAAVAALGADPAARARVEEREVGGGGEAGRLAARRGHLERAQRGGRALEAAARIGGARGGREEQRRELDDFGGEHGAHAAERRLELAGAEARACDEAPRGRGRERAGGAAQEAPRDRALAVPEVLRHLGVVQRAQRRRLRLPVRAQEHAHLVERDYHVLQPVRNDALGLGGGRRFSVHAAGGAAREELAPERGLFRLEVLADERDPLLEPRGRAVAGRRRAEARVAEAVRAHARAVRVRQRLHARARDQCLAVEEGVARGHHLHERAAPGEVEVRPAAEVRAAEADRLAKLFLRLGDRGVVKGQLLALANRAQRVKRDREPPAAGHHDRLAVGRAGVGHARGKGAARGRVDVEDVVAARAVAGGKAGVSWVGRSDSWRMNSTTRQLPSPKPKQRTHPAGSSRGRSSTML